MRSRLLSLAQTDSRYALNQLFENLNSKIEVFIHYPFSMNINLETEKIEQICHQWQIEELALFGSVLREDFNSQSDIDVLITFAEDAKITFFDLDAIEEQLGKLFSRPVDVVTRKAIEQSHNWIRQKNILENAQIIYEQRSRDTAGFN